MYPKTKEHYDGNDGILQGLPTCDFRHGQIRLESCLLNQNSLIITVMNLNFFLVYNYKYIINLIKYIYKHFIGLVIIHVSRLCWSPLIYTV